MFRFIAEMIVRSKIEKENTGRKKQSLPWEKIEKIALIIGKNEKLNKSAIDKFIQDSKKFIEVFYVELNSKQATYGDWHCFSKKDASLLNLPKSKVAEDLRKKEFDLVINTASEDELFPVALCTALPAAYKCSSSAKYNNIVLVVERSGSNNLTDYLSDMVKYLKMIKA